MASSMLSPARSPLNSKPIAGTAFCILSCSSSWGCLVPRDSVETTKKVEGSGLLPRPAAAGRRNNACVGARGQAGRWPVLRRTLAPPCRFTPKLRGGAHGDQTSARARHASRKPSTADLVVRLCDYCQGQVMRLLLTLSSACAANGKKNPKRIMLGVWTAGLRLTAGGGSGHRRGGAHPIPRLRRGDFRKHLH